MRPTHPPLLCTGRLPSRFEGDWTSRGGEEKKGDFSLGDITVLGPCQWLKPLPLVDHALSKSWFFISWVTFMTPYSCSCLNSESYTAIPTGSFHPLPHL